MFVNEYERFVVHFRDRSNRSRICLLAARRSRSLVFSAKILEKVIDPFCQKCIITPEHSQTQSAEQVQL